jgi:hypothetical protein
MKKSAILACVLFALLLPSWVLHRAETSAPPSGKYAEVLEGMKKNKFSLFAASGHIRLIVEEDGDYKIGRIGTDYVEVSSEDETRTLPLSNLEVVEYKK